jgi:hypothetical protein
MNKIERTKSKNKKTEKDVDVATTQFMLQEIQIAFERWKHTDQIDEVRINSFLTLTAAALGVILLLLQLQASLIEILNAGIIVFLFAWLIGTVIFRMILKSNEVITKFIRIQNRARRYFIELDSSIDKYLDYPISDDIPRFNRTSGKRNLILVIVSVFFGLLIGDIFSIANGFIISWEGLTIGGIGFLIHLGGLEYITVRMLRQLDKDFDVRFPMSKRRQETS